MEARLNSDVLTSTDIIQFCALISRVATARCFGSHGTKHCQKVAQFLFLCVAQSSVSPMEASNLKSSPKSREQDGKAKFLGRQVRQRLP